MIGYIAGFTVYTLAIIGVILLAFVIAKKSMMGFGMASKKELFLDIECSLNVAPRKTVQVLRAGNEKFLIALDPERTTSLTKLSPDSEIYTDRLFVENIEDKIETQITENTSIMRSVLAKLTK